MAYITKEQITPLQFEPDAAEGETLDALIDSASRMIDRLCGVSNGYFEAADTAATDQSIEGTGTAWLRLPPIAEPIDPAADVAYASGATLPTFRQVRDELGFYWLICNEGQCWAANDQVVVTAKWGFDETPLEIQEAVIELAIATYRTADPARERAVSDAGGDLARAPQIPARVRETCMQWRKLQPATFA